MSTSSFVPQRKNPSATNVAKRRALRMQELSAITVTLQPIARLKLDPKNPRVHSARQIRQIARSIESFGFNVPILVDSELKVIAGHGRVLAGLQLGLSEVPIIRLDHLSVRPKTS
jgi:hypothetical protein